jgi:hypothetical protein
MKYLICLILIASIATNIFQYYQIGSTQKNVDTACSSIFQLSSNLINLTKKKEMVEDEKIKLLTNLFLLNYKLPKCNSASFNTSEYDTEMFTKAVEMQNAIPPFKYFAYVAIYQLKESNLFEKVNTYIIPDYYNKTEPIAVKELMNIFIKENKLKF